MVRPERQKTESTGQGTNSARNGRAMESSQSSFAHLQSSRTKILGARATVQACNFIQQLVPCEGILGRFCWLQRIYAELFHVGVQFTIHIGYDGKSGEIDSVKNQS